MCGVRTDKHEVWARVTEGTYAGVEGRLKTDLYEVLNVGDMCVMQLESVKPRRGFIDFALLTVDGDTRAAKQTNEAKATKNKKKKKKKNAKNNDKKANSKKKDSKKDGKMKK